MGRPCRDCEAAEIRLASECQAREEEANSKGLEYKCTCPPSPTGSCTHGPVEPWTEVGGSGGEPREALCASKC